MTSQIPEEVKNIADILEKNNHEAYLVGGCVRDLLAGKKPKDWDIATDALPERVQKLFPDSVYENSFGTVGIKTRSEEETTKVVEITTFRIEGKYSDVRRPDEVKFAKTIEEDLSRRDFTINAIAMTPNGEIVDPHKGKEDIKKKVIRTVGDPDARFKEDALRLLRAIRLSVQLGFVIEKDTIENVTKNAKLLSMIAEERIRDEFTKIILSDPASDGIILLEKTNLLQYILPELRDGIACGQNKHHLFTVFEHEVRSLEYAAKNNYSLEVRLASLTHDIGKPKTKRGTGPDCTFYGHEIVGARIAQKALTRLRFRKEIIDKVTHLVRYHMFYYNVGEVSESGVRRFLSRIGPENVDDFIKIREADRIGSGVPKAKPYKIRHLLFMIEKVKSDPVSPKMLKINGTHIMEILKIEPGPKIGAIIAILLEEVLDDPTKNTEEYLKAKVEELGVMSDVALKTLSQKAKQKKQEFEEEAEEEMKSKYYVK